MRET
ncbi:hypothetical protein S40285_08255 [Stachybotrys chlorohalonatus IBT 40285]|jgi:tubulin monoglycylase TTLL3/8